MKKLIVIFAVLLAAAVYIACNTRQEPVSQNNASSGERLRAPEEKAVKRGETVEISGLYITLNSIVQDFRCGAQTAQCPEAGGISVNVTLNDTIEKHTRNIASDEVPTTYGGYNVSIIMIEPEKKLDEVIPQEDYVITFKVEPAAATDNAHNSQSTRFACEGGKSFSVIFSGNVAETMFPGEANSIFLVQLTNDPHVYSLNDGAIELMVEGGVAGAVKNGENFSDCSAVN